MRMATKPIDNERRACDAVAKVLKERFAARRANATSLAQSEFADQALGVMLRPSAIMR